MSNTSGIKSLDMLLRSMKPKLVNGEFVFCTLEEKQLLELEIAPILIFREDEGITIIVEKSVADRNFLSYEGIWAMITLTVHSDLSAIGFLAAITNKLTENWISVNIVSAFFHDHLFVQAEMVEKAMKLLYELSIETVRL